MLRLAVFATTAACVAFLFVAVPAQAEEIETESETETEPEPARHDDYDRTGIYAGIDFGGTFYLDVKDDLDETLDALGLSGHTEEEEPLGFGARVGYRFLPNLAGEVQFQWYSGAKVRFTGNVLGDPKTQFEQTTFLKLETLTLTGNLKAYLLTGRIQPFLLAGGGLIHHDTEDVRGIGQGGKGDDFTGRFGGGIDLYFNRNVVLVLDTSYLLTTGDADHLDQVQISVGINYRF